MIRHLPGALSVSKKSITSYIFIIALATAVFFLPAYAQENSEQKLVVNEIIFEGNEHTPADVIMTNVRTRPDAYFNEKIVSEDSRRIIIMPQIRNVTWVARPVEGDDTKVDIIFVVKEAATVSDIEFQGNTEIKTKKLIKKLPFEQDDYLDAYMANRGAREIELYYKDKGYYFASVTIDDSRADSEGVIVYQIKEGPKLKVTKVRFEGRESFPKYKVKSQTKTRPRSWFGIFSKGKLDDLRIETDVDSLAQFYHEEGFLDAKVSVREDFNDDNSKVEVVFLIDEGPRYYLSEISFQGNSVYTAEEIDEVVTLEQGDFMRNKNIDMAEKAIKELYGKNGYIYTTARPLISYTDNPGEAKLTFSINEGKKYYLNKVIVTGNYETQDKVIRRDFDRHGFLPGEIYDQEAANKAKRRLAGSGIFNSVEVQAVGDYNDKRDAVVEVEETNTGLLLFGVGVDTNNGVLGQFSIEQRNFDASRPPESLGEFFSGNAYVGGGQRLKLSIEPGTDMTRGNLKFYEPYLYDQPIYLDYNLFLFKRWRESHEERRRGTSLTLGHRFDNDWSIEGTAKVELVQIGEFDYRVVPDPLDPNHYVRGDVITPDQFTSVEGDNWLTSFKFGIGRNTTDRYFRPTEGYKFNTSVEQYGVFGGDHSFTELSSGITFYDTIYEDIVERRTVWATRISGSKIYGDAPAFEKFYAGGIGTLRGFDYRGVSPRGGRDDDPVGSSYIFMAGSEITHPIFEETLYGKIFCDSGFVSEGPYRVAVGFGIEIVIPQFFQQVPMHFDFGFPLVEDDRDETELFSFNFGLSF